MLLLGLDVGTTSVKATVFNEKGVRQGQGMQGYEVRFPGEGRAEQDAELVWQKACLAVQEAVGERGSQVEAVSLSVQGDAVLLIDSLGNPLGPVHLGMDYRGRAEVQRLEACFGTENLHLRTGMAPHPLCALPKMMWLVQQEPTLWERAWKAVTYEEFFLLRMGCEEAIIDETMASRTLAYSMQGNCWDQEILAQAGISLEKMSRICSSGEVVGTVSKKCSQEMGLWTGAALVAGAHDQVCAALGAGVGGAGNGIGFSWDGRGAFRSAVWPYQGRATAASGIPLLLLCGAQTLFHLWPESSGRHCVSMVSQYHAVNTVL